MVGNQRVETPFQHVVVNLTAQPHDERDVVVDGARIIYDLLLKLIDEPQALLVKRK